MIKIGVIGAGHLGKIHISILKRLENFELIGFFDIDKKVQTKVEEEYKVKAFKKADLLIEQCDAISIVTPTDSHYDYAIQCLKKSKHIFIEKPLAFSLDEALHLIKISSEASVKVQVGHVERFNPAFNAAKSTINNPMFIEAHRLSIFNPRGTEVPVVLDLMIHDIDIILSTVKSNIKKISASGVSVISNSPDIANARIEFDNGCVANITASRISLKNMRKCRFFQKDAYISIDFYNKEADIIKINDIETEQDPYSILLDMGNDNAKKQILIQKPEISQNNAIEDEYISFYNCIINNSNPIVTIEDGYNALNVAFQILDILRTTS